MSISYSSSSRSVSSVLLVGFGLYDFFKACIDGWLSAASQVVRVWSETDHNQQQYLFLYIM